MKKHLVVMLSLLLVVLALGACGSINKATPEALDDAAMEADVRAKLLEDVELKAFSFEVKVDQGTVTLGGHVDNNAQRTKAAQAAREVSGVRRVINNLHVKGS